MLQELFITHCTKLGLTGQVPVSCDIDYKIKLTVTKCGKTNLVPKGLIIRETLELVSKLS